MARLNYEECEILSTLRIYGLTQRKVAAALEVTPALVSMWAHGKRKASPEHLAKLRNLEYWVSYYKAANRSVNRKLPVFE
jgi:transcriptional regulator with XRE-family HTH domain